MMNVSINLETKSNSRHWGRGMTEYIELRIDEDNGRGVHFYVAGQSRKFKSEAEKEKQQIESALRLQELVKKGSEFDTESIYLIDYALDGDEFKQVCKYILKESQNIDKERSKVV